jgi:hypothetical protein
MRRIRIVGLCLVAVFATTAVAASSASAALPELYECAKAVKVGKVYTGKYNDKKCSEKNEAGTGKYELQPGVGKGKVFKGKGKVATLHTPAIGGEVTCKTNKSEGKNSSPTTQSGVVAIFKTCTSLGKKCTSAGAKVGEIKTNPLGGVFGYISKAPLKVGVDLTGEGGKDSADFTCEGLVIETKGSVIGEITGNVNSFNKTTLNNFVVTASPAFVQVPTKFEGGPTQVLQTIVNGSGPFESGQQAEVTVKGEELNLKA